MDEQASEEAVLAGLASAIELGSCLFDDDAQRYAEGILDGYRVAIRRLRTAAPGTACRCGS